MRIARNIFATAFAVVLASGLAACEADRTEFQETPPAEEIEVFPEESGGQQQLQQERQHRQKNQQQLQQPNQQTQQPNQTTPQGQQNY